MKIKTLPLGALSTNCYIIEDEAAQKCAVIDQADNSSAIIAATEKQGIKIEKIILTHAHFDHMMALPALYEKSGAQVIVGRLDAPALSHPVLNLSSSFMGASFTFTHEYTTVDEGSEITLGDNVKLKVMSTPGHTPGSICLVANDEKSVFTGDTVFAGTIGRTDFPGGNLETILKSLSRVLSLDEKLTLYSGHGPITTVGEEKRSNPYYRR